MFLVMEKVSISFKNEYALMCAINVCKLNYLNHKLGPFAKAPRTQL